MKNVCIFDVTVVEESFRYLFIILAEVCITGKPSMGKAPVNMAQLLGTFFHII
jgi:hypothetical protein